MIGLVLVSHGRLAIELIAALEHVVGPQQQVRAVCIDPSDDMDARRREIVDAIACVDDGDGVVVLTDMFGGTPSNIAMTVLGGDRLDVIAGVNLPMLVKLAQVRQDCPFEQAVGAAEEAGRKYIRVASRILTKP